MLFTEMADIYRNGWHLPKWPAFTEMATVNVCLIFCYFFQMLQFDFTCVQAASSARMSIQKGANAFETLQDNRKQIEIKQICL